MMIVGLTGGIGSGKSTVAGFFSELGVPVYDSDKEAKILMVESETVRRELINLFGEEAFIDKKLNKTHISSIVFKEKEKLAELNAIVHPAVRNHFAQWVEQQSSDYVIQETALIFENGAQENYDAVILVTAPENVRIQRVMKRDGASEVEIRARIAHQMSDEQKIALADFVIENHELKSTKMAVNTIHKELMDRTLS
jgi:dephospho-CoA kinase